MAAKRRQDQRGRLGQAGDRAQVGRHLLPGLRTERRAEHEERGGALIDADDRRVRRGDHRQLGIDVASHDRAQEVSLCAVGLNGEDPAS